MWEIDTPIDADNLEQAELTIPMLHAKYHTMWIKAQRRVLDAEVVSKDLERRLYEYYRRMIVNPDDLADLGKDEPWQHTTNSNENKSLVETDPMMIGLSREIKEMKLCVEVLENLLQRLANRGFHIKNIIEIRKLDKGFL